MLRGLYIAGGGMTERTAKFDTLANNIANMQTDTFKRDRTVYSQFDQMLITRMQSGKNNEDIGNLSMGSYVSSEPFIDFSQGPLTRSDNDHDVAIEGPGFVKVRIGTGEIRYTRDAHWNVNRDNVLVNKSGATFLDENDQPIIITGNGKLAFNHDGDITQNGQSVGKLSIVEITDFSSLQKDGELNYKLSGDPALLERDAEITSLRQNYVERANFSPISVVTEMIILLREYESAQKVVQVYDETLDMATSKLGATPG